MSRKLIDDLCSLLRERGYFVAKKPPGRPHKYGVPLTNADHQRMLRARRKAEKAGLTFNPSEWIRNSLGDGE